MLIQRIKVTNILSFGPNSQDLTLNSLNVLIGPNGSGKSNLIEAIALLQAAPTDLSPTIGFGGGIRNWQWRGEQSIYSSELKIAVENPLPFGNGQRLLYLLSFAEKFGRFHLVEEVLKDESTPTSQNSHPYCTVVEGRAKLRYWDGVPSEPRRLISDELEPQKSILSQRKDIRHYPEITFLGQQLARIRF